MTKRTLRGPGIHIELDRNEVIESDPGAGTPAIVVRGSLCGTYWCVAAEGEIDGHRLTPAQCAWLNDQESAVESFLFGGA